VPVNPEVEQKVANEAPVQASGPTPPAPTPYTPIKEGVDQLVKQDPQIPTTANNAEQRVGNYNINASWRETSVLNGIHGQFAHDTNSVLEALAQHVPEIKQYPDVALSIALSAQNLNDPIGLGQAAMTLQQMHEFQARQKDYSPNTQYGVNEAENTQAQPGVLGALGQIPGDITGTVHALTNPAPGQGQAELESGIGSAGAQAVTALESIPAVGDSVHDYIAFQMGALHLGADAASALGPGIARTLGSLVGHSAGGIGAITGDPTLQARVTTDVAHGVNAAFDFLQHQYRMLSEVQREHGDAAMIQAALPFLVTVGAMAAGSAITGGGSDVAGAGALAEAGTAEAAAAGRCGPTCWPLPREIPALWLGSCRMLVRR